MFEGNQAIKNSAPDSPKQPLTEFLGTEINSLNKHHADLMSAIENKLHTILNLRKPESDGNKGANEIPINDFAKHMGQQITFMQQNGFRLSNILDHLNQIV